MRIDQLPVASAIENTDTLPFSNDGTSKQISVGNLTNSIRDNVYGAPLTASTSSAMTDTSRIYVYTGTTGGGFTNGHWYYYNGSAWTDGGIYNSIAVQTDPTLTLEGVPADAKATGELKTVIDDKLAEFDVAVETFYPHDGYSGPKVTVEGTVDAPPAELVIYGMSLQEGATPSPSAPVDIVTAGSGGTLAMVSAGKNLLIPKADGTYTQQGVTCVVSDGSISVSGTYTGSAFSVMVFGNCVLPPGSYRFNGQNGVDSGNYKLTLQLFNLDTNQQMVNLNRGTDYAFTLTSATNVQVRIGFRAGLALSEPAVMTPMIRPAAIADATFAAYNSIAAAIPTPNGLPGIPVTSGGNYTDTSGQQWICDTIDLEAGTYTQRCGIIASYNGETLPGAWLSSMDVYQSGNTPTTGANVVYALAAPAVTSLTDAQLTALKSLRGRKGLTNLYSADPAGPEILAELYIDIPTYIQSLLSQMDGTSFIGLGDTQKVTYNPTTHMLTIPGGRFYVYKGTGAVYSQAISLDLTDILSSQACVLWMTKAGTIYAARYYGKNRTDPEDVMIGYVYRKNVCIAGVADYQIFVTDSTSEISIYCFGDSITAGVGSTKLYHMYFHEMEPHYHFYNYGVGGTGYITTVSGDTTAGNGVEGDGATITAEGSNNILNVMQGVAADMPNIIIFGGTNDYGTNKSLNAFRTQVQETLDYAQTRTPHILVISPLKRDYRDNYGIGPNQSGLYLKEYSDVIKEECIARGITFADGFEISLNPANDVCKASFMPDGLHPNDAGHARIARYAWNHLRESMGV